jgi:hypothetical protein
LKSDRGVSVCFYSPRQGHHVDISLFIPSRFDMS